MILVRIISGLRVAGLIGLVCLIGGCGGAVTNDATGSDQLVCIIKPAEPTASSEIEQRLIEELYPDAQFYELSDFLRAKQACLIGGRTMVVLAPERFPIHFWTPLEQYLYAGGRALFIGRSPFQARVQWAEGHETDWKSRQLVHLQQAVTAGGVSSVQLWGPQAEEGEDAATVRIAHDGLLPWSGVTVDVPDFKQFNTLMSPVWPDAQFRWKDGINALGFYAFGDERTTRLTVRCEDIDGESWGTGVTLQRQWTPMVVPLEHMNPLSGTHEKPLTVSRIRRLYMGLDNAVAPQTPGAHSYGLSDVKLISDLDLDSYTAWPKVPLLTPSYARVVVQADYLQYMLTDEQLGTEPFEYDSPLPLRKSVAQNPRRIIRAIPVYVGMERNETGISGWGASIVVVPNSTDATAIFGWIGLSGNRENRKWMKDVVRACVKRLQDDVFMVSSPKHPVTVEAHDLIPLEVAWIAPRSRAAQIRVVGELLAMDGRRLRRVTSPMLSVAELAAGIHHSEISLGRSPGLQAGRQDYIVRVALENLSADSHVFDESIQYLKVTGDRPEDRGSWLKCSGSRFLSERQAVFLMGINYNPLDNQLLSEQQQSAWMDPGVFCADQVRRDLQMLKDINVNAVKIVYEVPEQAPALRFFVHEAERLGIRVGVEMPALNPLNYDLEHIEHLIHEAGIVDQPNIFAIYFSADPLLLTKAQRDAVDPLWQAWLVSQYGSLSRAEKLMGKPAWHDGEGLSGPGNKELSSNGRHTVATVVYRRFVEDTLSRRYGFLVRFIRDLGCRQLVSRVSAPVISGDAAPYDMAVAGIHCDFLSPSAAGVVGPKEEFLELGFITAYARGGRGVVKPVVWSDFGVSVGDHPEGVDLENQERVYDNVFNMISLSAAAGSFAKNYSSARGFETQDYGVVSPAGKKRPASMAFTRHTRRLRNSMVYPSIWKGRTFSRSADARGLSGLFDQWKAEYATEMARGDCVEIRPFGFGKTTEDMPRLTLGGVPFSNPSPMECANAEWGQIWLNGRALVRLPDAEMHVAWGDKVRLELINTGVATWSPSQADQHGTVWVLATSPRGYETRVPVSVVPSGGTESIEWTASEAGVWRLQPVILGVGPFGEVMHVRVGGRGKY